MQAEKSKDSLPSRSSTPDSVDMDDSFDDGMTIPVDEEAETSSPPSRGRGKSCRKANFDAKTRNDPSSQTACTRTPCKSAIPLFLIHSRDTSRI